MLTLYRNITPSNNRHNHIYCCYFVFVNSFISLIRMKDTRELMKLTIMHALLPFTSRVIVVKCVTE